MTITATPTTEYTIVIHHLELDFTSDEGQSLSPAKQMLITKEQLGLPIVINADPSKSKDDYYDAVCDLINERSGYPVLALDIDWYASGIDPVDIYNLSPQLKEKLYWMVERYTRKGQDQMRQQANEAMDDFLFQVGLQDDGFSSLFEALDEMVSLGDVRVEGFQPSAFPTELKQVALNNLP